MARVQTEAVQDRHGNAYNGEVWIVTKAGPDAELYQEEVGGTPYAVGGPVKCNADGYPAVAGGTPLRYEEDFYYYRLLDAGPGTPPIREVQAVRGDTQSDVSLNARVSALEARAIPAPIASWGDLAEPIIVPHRMGGLAIAPDNALESARVSLGNAFECIDGGDWRMLSDGAVVCMHDDTLTRTALGNPNSPVALADHIAESWASVLIDGHRLGTTGEFPSPPAWQKLLPAPFLDDVLSFVKEKGICFTPEIKASIATGAVVDGVVRYGLEDATLFQSFLLADLAPAKAAGIRTCLIVQDETTTTAAIIAADVDYVVYLFSSAVTDAYLNTLRAAGIKIGLWTVNRQADLAAQEARGAIAIVFSDDPAHVRGIGGGDLSATDRFKAQAWDTGMRASSPSAGNRGYFTQPDKWTLPSGDLFTLQGWGRMASSLQVKLTFEVLSATSSHWGGIIFGAANDKTASDGLSSAVDIYEAFVTRAGSLQLWKRPAGSAATQLGSSVATAAISAGGTAVLKVEWVAPNDVKVTRVDTGHTLQVTDVGPRGQFFSFGKHDSGGGMVISYSEVVTT